MRPCCFFLLPFYAATSSQPPFPPTPQVRGATGAQGPAGEIGEQLSTVPMHRAPAQGTAGYVCSGNRGTPCPARDARPWGTCALARKPRPTRTRLRLRMRRMCAFPWAHLPQVFPRAPSHEGPGSGLAGVLQGCDRALMHPFPNLPLPLRPYAFVAPSLSTLLGRGHRHGVGGGDSHHGQTGQGGGRGGADRGEGSSGVPGREMHSASDESFAV